MTNIKNFHCVVSFGATQAGLSEFDYKHLHEPSSH
jgi:hypothetical protein